jgi:hypothetical protein
MGGMDGWLALCVVYGLHSENIHGQIAHLGPSGARTFFGCKYGCALCGFTIPLKIIMRVRTRCVLYGFNDGDDDYRYDDDDYMEFQVL